MVGEKFDLSTHSRCVVNGLVCNLPGCRYQVPKIVCASVRLSPIHVLWSLYSLCKAIATVHPHRTHLHKRLNYIGLLVALKIVLLLVQFCRQMVFC